MQSQFIYSEDCSTAINNRAELELEPRKTQSKAEVEDERRDEDESIDVVFNAEVASLSITKRPARVTKGICNTM